MNNKTDYNQLAGDFTDYKANKNSIEWVQGYNRLTGLLGFSLKPGDTVLDFGCGTGNYARTLKETYPGLVVIGVDSAQSMVDEARRLDPSGDYVLYNGGIQDEDNLKSYSGNLEELVNGRVINAAVANFVFCTMLNPYEILGICKEIHKVLKTGCPFYIMETNWPVANGKDYGQFRCLHYPELKQFQEVETILRKPDGSEVLVTDLYLGDTFYGHVLGDIGVSCTYENEPENGVFRSRHYWDSPIMLRKIVWKE